MTIGLKDLVYATITEGEGGVPTYGAPKKLAEVMTADLSVTTAEGTLYADDAVSESVKEFVKEINVAEGYVRVHLIEGMATDEN